eukprot:72990-Rhodomonas_salina.2
MHQTIHQRNSERGVSQLPVFVRHLACSGQVAGLSCPQCQAGRWPGLGNIRGRRRRAASNHLLPPPSVGKQSDRRERVGGARNNTIRGQAGFAPDAAGVLGAEQDKRACDPAA